MSAKPKPSAPPEAAPPAARVVVRVAAPAILEGGVVYLHGTEIELPADRAAALGPAVTPV